MAQGGRFPWLLLMLDRFTPVNVPFAGKNGAGRSFANIERSTGFWRWPTNGFAGFLPVCWHRKSGAAASSRWRASLVCIVTPSRWVYASFGRNVVYRPAGSAALALAANHWRKNARGAHGLAGAFARCHRRRSDHRHEVDASLAAETLQGLASPWCEGVSRDARSIVATPAFLVANLSQAKSRHSQSRPSSTISLLAQAAELVSGSKLAGN